MKVLFAPANYIISDKSGSELTRVYDMLRFLSLRGVDIVALVGYDYSSKKLSGKMIAVMKGRKSSNSFIDTYNRIRFTYEYYKTALWMLRHSDFDIIHHVAPLGVASYNLLALFNRIDDHPFVIGPAQPVQRMDSFDGFCYWMNVKPNISARIVASTLPLSLRPFYTMFKKTVMSCDVFICANEAAKRDFQPLVKRARMLVIPNGVDVGIFRPSKVTSEEKDCLEILTVGNLNRRKGTEYVIHAMKKIVRVYPKTILRIIGEGQQLTFLKRLVFDSNIAQNVIFEGLLPHAELVTFYQQCNIFCLPSLYDPSPNAILEAMACRKPIVATAVGGIPEMVRNGLEGLLVPPANAEKLSNALLELIQNDELRDVMGLNALKRIKERYSWEQVADRYMWLYHMILEE